MRHLSTKFFDMVHYGKGIASNIETGPRNRTSIAAVDVHEWTIYQSY